MTGSYGCGDWTPVRGICASLYCVVMMDGLFDLSFRRRSVSTQARTNRMKRMILKHAG